MSRLHVDQGDACKNKKVCLATVVYDTPDDSYVFAIQKSREALRKAGLQSAYILLSGNPHVDDARNRVVQDFLATDCTDLFFLDADVSWEPNDLVKLCQYDKAVVGAVYPYRREDKVNQMPVQLLANALVRDGLLEVEGLPTGFMRIRRHVIEELAEVCEEFNGNNGHSTMTPMIFQRTLIDGTRWGGDLNFCRHYRALGGHVWCDPEVTLGHAAKVIFKDSLGASLRRAGETTLGYVADKIRGGTWTLADLEEAHCYDDNKWGADPAVLALAVAYAAKATGPIIETGSGLSTILMAAATEQSIYCLEHDEHYARRLQTMAEVAGVKEIGICLCPIVDGWYDLGDAKGLPEHFAFGLNDGPPRQLGSRKGFFEHFGDRVNTIVSDDANDIPYREYLESWAGSNNFDTTYVEPRALVMTK